MSIEPFYNNFLSIILFHNACTTISSTFLYNNFHQFIVQQFYIGYGIIYSFKADFIDNDWNTWLTFYVKNELK